MLRQLIQRHPRSLAVLMTAALLAGLALVGVPPVPRLISASYDRATTLGGGVSMLASSPVVVVYLDLDSYWQEKQNPNEPWSRALHAKLVRRLAQAQAKAVVFDIIFDQPGPSPAADDEFAEAIRANGQVLLAAELDVSARATPGELGVRQGKEGKPLASLLRVAAGWGIAKFAIDEDLVVRQLFPGFLAQNQPSLTWAAAKFLNLPAVRADGEEATDRWVRYYGPAYTIPYVSYTQALDPRATSDEFFRDKIVLIGPRPIAGGFRERKDEFRSPFSAWGGVDQFMPAVEVHATEMVNLVRGDWLRRLPAPAEVWLLVLLAVALPALLFRFRPLPAAGLAAALEAVLVAGVSWGFTPRGIWFPWLLVGAVQIPGALGGSILFHSIDWYRTRRRLEALRREAEAKIREQAALLDKAQDAILVQNLEGGLVYANPSAVRLYGWAVEELRRDGALQQLFAPSGAKLGEARRVTLEKGEWLGELGQATREGRQLIVESRWTLIRDEAGLPKSFLLINTDVTEKKRLEAQVLRAQRMETIGSLAGGMAHDLNNALSPILMGLQLIGRKAQDEETRRMLAMMEANTHRGADMVRQVLTFSRGQDGERELVNLGRLVHEMENIVRQTLPKSITVAVMVPSDLWPVLGNPTQIHQVLLNLCVNARDAMPEGGELALAADNVELTSAEASEIPNATGGSFVVLLVSDTGIGIPPEILPRIFDPFFTTKEPGKGTGLGLATIARIVRNHGGFIGVKSEAGVGTSFEIYFPRAESVSASTAPGAAADVPRGNGERLLLIEDDRSVREIVSASLVEQGYQVASAANGAEAVALLQQFEQDLRLVLTVLNLPATRGVSTLESIRSRRPDLPIILMSSEGEAAKGQIRPGVSSLLPKPFRLEELLAAVAHELRR